MYSVVFDYPIAPVVPMLSLEIYTPDAVYDQVQAFYRDGLTYDGLMGVYERTTSEVEADAAKMIITGKDWQLRPAYDGEYIQYVEETDVRNGKWACFCWARVDASTLYSDANTAAAKGDAEFAKFLSSLAADIETAEYDQRAEASYYMRRPVKW